MQFTRTLSVKNHPTGQHYVLSIPRPVAEALDLHEDEGGLVSIFIQRGQIKPYKKGTVHLQAYRETQIPWRETFNPAVWTDPTAHIFKPFPVPPNTLGRSRPTGCGKVFDFKVGHRASLEGLRFLQAARKALKLKVFPHGFKRGPKRRRIY
jgi:hypothetical protein